ncbi:MAG: class I SAM-dependent methyltransferase [Hymenobacteraceae bacterium]|nr:class I SAM-dependent methyltransferase [Hymenobacteraceae bacterium]
MPQLQRSKSNSSHTPDYYNPQFVQNLFDQMASSYEAMNYITSFGFSIRWRNQFIKILSAKEGVEVCDLMTGLGENWGQIKKRWQNSGVVAIDFSEGMLKSASQKNKLKFDNKVTIVHSDVFDNHFKDSCFDVIVCAFGLKTLNEEQIYNLAQETKRLLKPGGQYSFIEVSVPENLLLRKLYMFYLQTVIPVLGRLFQGNPEQYRMLGVYTKNFVNSEQAFNAFKSIGLNPKYKKYFNGCATGFYGVKS